MGDEVSIPGFTIGAMLGAGGMSNVYLARQDSLSRQVALKVLTAPDDDPTFTKRFKREAWVVAKLDHSKIVTIYDIGNVGRYHYISQEFLSGGSLREEIRKGMSVPRVLFIMRCLADALGYAHESGVVHRDIKPQNILIREDRYRSAVLIDFGIAKTISSVETTLTAAGTICGSPAYLSPEQAQGEALDGRSDIYSLGIVFYQMLNGGIPYKNKDAVSQALMHVHDPIPLLSDSHRKYFQSILERCLAKNRNERYQKAHDIIPAINDASEHWLLDHPEDLVHIQKGVPDNPRRLGQKYEDKEYTVLSSVSVEAAPTILSPEAHNVARSKWGLPLLVNRANNRLVLGVVGLIIVTFGLWVGVDFQVATQEIDDEPALVDNKTLAIVGDNDQISLGSSDSVLSYPDGVEGQLIHLRGRAEKLAGKEVLFSKESENAFHVYDKILQLDSGNRIAKVALARLTFKQLVMVRESLVDGETSEGRAQLRDLIGHLE